MLPEINSTEVSEGKTEKHLENKQIDKAQLENREHIRMPGEQRTIYKYLERK